MSIPSQMWLSSYSSVDDCKLDIRNHLLIESRVLKTWPNVCKNIIEKDIYFPIYLLIWWAIRVATSRCAGDSQIWWKQGNSVTNSSDWEILGFTISQQRICKWCELDVNITISSNQRQIEWNQRRLEKIECNQMFQKDIDMQVNYELCQFWKEYERMFFAPCSARKRSPLTRWRRSQAMINMSTWSSWSRAHFQQKSSLFNILPWQFTSAAVYFFCRSHLIFSASIFPLHGQVRQKVNVTCHQAMTSFWSFFFIYQTVTFLFIT